MRDARKTKGRMLQPRLAVMRGRAATALELLFDLTFAIAFAKGFIQELEAFAPHQTGVGGPRRPSEPCGGIAGRLRRRLEYPQG